MATQADISAALQQAGVTVYGLQVVDNSVIGTVGTDDERQQVYATVAGIDNSMNLNISVDPGFATMADNAAAVSDQTSSDQTSSAQTYTVQAGDNMRKIARHVYGDEMQWKRIWEANRDKIPNPDVVRQGLELTIPA